MHALDSAWKTLKRDFDSALSRKIRDLNHVFRRLRNYEDQYQWLNALKDGAAIGADAFAVFTIEGGTLRLRSTEGLSLDEALAFPLTAGRAFTAIAESRELLTVLRTASETGPLAASDPNSSRAHLIPITNADRLVALVFADGSQPADIETLELVASMASAVLDRQSNRKKQVQIGPAPAFAEPLQEPQALSLPAWATLSNDARALHSRAQRFARRTVAEMQLSRPEACRAGREQNNFYLLLQGEVDRARGTYLKQFMTAPSMVDYLHLELIKAVDGDEQRLGADYPGHLV